MSHDKRSCIINYACIINVIYAKNEIFGHFLEFGTSGGFDIAYNDSKKCSLTVGYGIRSCTINYAYMINVIYAENEIFGHLLELGTSGGFDIAYNAVKSAS